MRDAYFVLESNEAIAAALERGELVETTFDVAEFLFSGGGGVGAGGGGSAGSPVVSRDSPAITQRMPVVPVSVQRFGSPRDELLALASVAASDGEASFDDQLIMQRAAVKRGLPPLLPEQMRVWRPNEIDPPRALPDRERVLEEMFQMAYSDGQLDDSELRVIRDYARAWGVDPTRLEEWTSLYAFADSSRFERWLRRLGFFLFPAR
jgi:hypothetical protein